MTSLESRNLYKKLHRGVNKYPIAPMSPKPKILKMQFLLKRSKMGSIFYLKQLSMRKPEKTAIFCCFFKQVELAAGPVFWDGA